MVQSFSLKNIAYPKKPGRAKAKSIRYKKLASMGKISAGIINKLCSPIDAANRFINLSLQTQEENSQSREFLLESKEGIRKALQLLRRLNNYAKKIEREFIEISAYNEQSERLNNKRRQTRPQIPL